ncbi:MAG: hypothetical protein ACK5NX_01310 [Armatimonadota bacterium]
MFEGGYGTELGLIGGAVGGTLATKFYDWWTGHRRDSAENAANVTLVQGLAERVETLEARLKNLESDNDRLRSQLHTEQNRSVRLNIRIIALEAEIKRMGGAVPPHPDSDDAPSVRN